MKVTKLKYEINYMVMFQVKENIGFKLRENPKDCYHAN